MPLQFAIEEFHPKPGVGDDFSRHHNSYVVYNPVSQEVAEADPNGLVSLVNSNGETISKWARINDPLAKQARETAKSTARPHKDAIGEVLAVGDFVAYSELKSAYLNIGQVLSFSKHKVRIMYFGSKYGDSTVQKDPQSVIKIQPELI